MTTTQIEVECPSCGKTREITVPISGYQLWKSGTLIQQAMPDLSADDREGLLTGYCSSCWDSTFKDDPE